MAANCEPILATMPEDVDLLDLFAQYRPPWTLRGAFEAVLSTD
jgi:hypothetical protein